MKDIKAILEGIELTDEQRGSIISAVNENYRTIEETKRKSDRISELEEQNKALTEQIGNLEGEGEELQALRKQVEDYAAAEEQREADETEAAKRESFRAVFNDAIGDREFANSIVAESVFDKVYEKCTEQAGLDAKSVIDDITADTDGIWKNPQQEAAKMPSPSQLSSNQVNGEEAAKREIKDFLFRKRD